MGFIQVGHGNYVNADHIVSASCFRSQPVQKAIKAALKQHRLSDLTKGKITRAVLTMANGSIALVSVSPETLAKRCAQELGA